MADRVGVLIGALLTRIVIFSLMPSLMLKTDESALGFVSADGEIIIEGLLKE